MNGLRHPTKRRRLTTSLSTKSVITPPDSASMVSSTAAAIHTLGPKHLYTLVSQIELMLIANFLPIGIDLFSSRLVITHYASATGTKWQQSYDHAHMKSGPFFIEGDRPVPENSLHGHTARNEPNLASYTKDIDLSARDIYSLIPNLNPEMIPMILATTYVIYQGPLMLKNLTFQDINLSNNQYYDLCSTTARCERLRM